MVFAEPIASYVPDLDDKGPEGSPLHTGEIVRLLGSVQASPPRSD
jgi:hypothetical protein